MYKYLRFWTKMTAVYVLYGILAAIGVFAYSHFINVDFKEYGMKMVWGVWRIDIKKMLWNPVFYRLWGSEKKYIKGIFFY